LERVAVLGLFERGQFRTQHIGTGSARFRRPPPLSSFEKKGNNNSAVKFGGSLLFVAWKLFARIDHKKIIPA
jgi:hypothetical protein